MTAITDAEVIRDETTAGANTATRVGDCLVDIATQAVAATAAIDTVQNYGARIYMRNNATGTNVAVAGTYYKAAGTTQESFASGFTAAANKLTYSPDDGLDRSFRITANASIYCASGSHVICAALGVNGGVDLTTESESTMTAGTAKPSQICVDGVYTLSDGDFVELFVTDDGSGEVVTVTHMNMTIEPFPLNAPGNYCIEAINLFARAAVQPSTAEKSAINAAIVALKDAGYWARMDGIIVPRNAHDQQFGLLDWKRNVAASIHGSASWDTALGFVGSTDSGSYVNTNFTPSTDSVNYALNDCSMAVYVSALATVSNVNYFGKIGGTANQALYLGIGNHETGTMEGKINSSAGGASATGKAAIGLNSIGRTASNAWNIGVNGATQYTDTDTSGGLSTLPIYLLAVNNAGTASAMTNAKIAAWYAGDHFSTAEQSAIKAIFDTYFAT